MISITPILYYAGGLKARRYINNNCEGHMIVSFGEVWVLVIIVCICEANELFFDTSCCTGELSSLCDVLLFTTCRGHIGVSQMYHIPLKGFCTFRIWRKDNGSVIVKMNVVFFESQGMHGKWFSMSTAQYIQKAEPQSCSSLARSFYSSHYYEMKSFPVERHKLRYFVSKSSTLKTSSSDVFWS